MRHAGMSTEQVERHLANLTTLSRDNAAATDKVASSISSVGQSAKKAAVDVKVLQDSINAPKVGPVFSFAKALGSDSLSREFVKYQSEMAKTNAAIFREQQAGVLSADRSIGLNTHLMKTRELYKDIGV